MAKSKDEKKVPETIPYKVTQEDLDKNPDLAKAGVTVGQEIEIPNPALNAPEAGDQQPPAPPAPEAPASEEETPVVFSEALKDTLDEFGHIQNVWVSADGKDWYLKEMEGYTPFTRDEILNG